MKKAMILVMGLCLISAGGAFAHREGRDGKGRGPEKMEGRIDKRVTRLVKKLELSDEQKQQVEAVLKESAKARRTLVDEHKKKMKALMEGLDSKIEAVLGAEQKAKFQELKTKRKEWAGKGGKKGRKNRRGGRGYDKE